MNIPSLGWFKMNAASGVPALSPRVMALAALLLLWAAELSSLSAYVVRPRRYFRGAYERPLACARTAANSPGAGPVMTRFRGSVQWSISRIAEVQEFYLKRFGIPLPISAYGQTAFHTRLGFNHSRAVDVALSPDSTRGRELIRFLMRVGFPFIAFRRAVPGSASAPHIHIGPESTRFRQPPSLY